MCAYHYIQRPSGPCCGTPKPTSGSLWYACIACLQPLQWCSHVSPLPAFSTNLGLDVQQQVQNSTAPFFCHAPAEQHRISRQLFVLQCRFKEAAGSELVAEANAACLATATADGRPSNRMVLMKGYDEQGFRFYSNYSSRKGQELSQNSFASLCFWWEPLHRSVGLPCIIFYML